jgi:uridine kinase
VSGDGRESVIAAVVALIAAMPNDHPVRVAIDGPDAAGKTTLADELREPLEGAQRSVVRVSIDGFLRPRAERSEGGAQSAVGYYREAFDADEFIRLVLVPLRRGGDRTIRSAAYDYRADMRTVGEPVVVSDEAVVVVDGVFLQRPSFRDDWDVIVYVHVSEQETLVRARVRDVELFGGIDETERRYRERYLPAQELYRNEADPIASAHVLIDNEDPERPVLLRCEAP